MKAFGVLLLQACLLILALLILPSAKADHRGIPTKSPLPTLNRQKRTFGWGWLTGPNHQDWSRFHQSWRFPANLPSLEFFGDEDFSNLKRRIELLEIGQKRIVAFLRKLQADRNANPCLPTTSDPHLIPEFTPFVTTTIDATRLGGQQPTSTTTTSTMTTNNPPTTAQAPTTTTTTTTPTPSTTSIIIEEASTLAEDVPTTQTPPDSNDIVIVP